MARLHHRIRRRPIAFAPDIPAKSVEFPCGSTTRTPPLMPPSNFDIGACALRYRISRHPRRVSGGPKRRRAIRAMPTPLIANGFSRLTATRHHVNLCVAPHFFLGLLVVGHQHYGH